MINYVVESSRVGACSGNRLPDFENKLAFPTRSAKLIGGSQS